MDTDLSLETHLRTLFPKGHPEFVTLTMQEMQLHSDKNGDYSGGVDPLGNFKREAALFALYPGLDMSDPVVVCMQLLTKQYDAAMVLLSQGKKGDVESVAARLFDVSVYAKLGILLWKEAHQ